MKERLLLVSFFLALTAFAAILCAIQTAFWPQVFPRIPAPPLWIGTLLYVALYRTSLLAAVFAYLCTLALLPMTSMSEGSLLVSCLVVIIGAQSFKRRIYWQDTSYTMILGAMGSLLFDLTHFLVDTIRAKGTWVWPELLDWIIRGLLTPLAAPLIFMSCRLVERWLQQEQPIEFTAEVN